MRNFLAIIATLLPCAAFAQSAGTIALPTGTGLNSPASVSAAINAGFSHKVDVTDGFLTGPTLNGGQMQGFAGVLNVGPTDTSTVAGGFWEASDALWAPSTQSTYSLNNFFNVSLTQDSLVGGTVAQRWLNTNNVNFSTVTTTGPTGTPSTPSGMADSHTILYAGEEWIPAGLCDGQNGSSFTGTGGAPGNDCYQEIGGFENTATILSPGHYSEGVGSYFFDNSNGSGAVPARAVGFVAVIGKDSATQTYPIYGYQANSSGTQQTTDAPTSAYRVDGGWLNGLDLSGGTYNACEVLWYGGACTTSSTSGISTSLGSGTFSMDNAGDESVSGFQKIAPKVFASWPACSPTYEGMRVAVTDSTTNTWGATITGGGSYHVVGYCDGTNLTVAAK